jgi:hypothetical protein
MYQREAGSKQNRESLDEFLQTARCYIPGATTFHDHLCENSKSNRQTVSQWIPDNRL